MNILESITPTQVLAVVLIIYLIICLISFILGIRKFILRTKNSLNIYPYLNGEIPNPGYPNILTKIVIKRRKSTKKEINIFNK